MPKPTIITTTVNGRERVLLEIQERASGDLTLIVKHSVFAMPPCGSKPGDGDRVTEQRYSIHRSCGAADTNTIKYTKATRGGKRHTNYNVTRAVKRTDRFAVVFARRCAGLAAERYEVDPRRGNIISLGEHDAEYFQPYFVILVARPGRTLELTDSQINHTSLHFTDFTVAVLWQFLCFSDQDSSSLLSPTTFPEAEILAVDPALREDMRAMGDGSANEEIASIFHALKESLVTTMLEEAWSKLTDDEKVQHAHIYAGLKGIDIGIRSGVAFGPEHVALIRRAFGPPQRCG